MQKATAKRTPERASIPDKLFYKIGEVSKIAAVEPYVLRYWETEFTFLKPRKSKSGQRIYVKKDLALIFQIKDLLYKERFTIEGVRKKFSEGHKGSEEVSKEAPATAKKKAPARAETLEHVKQRLRDIIDHMG